MSADIHAQKILILDFGSQYSQLIARRIRELGVYCELYPFDLDEQRIKAFAPDGIILSGGPESVIADGTPRATNMIFEMGIPVLGVCYGMQTMAHQLGGKVASSGKKEFGHAKVRHVAKSALFRGIEDHFEAGKGVLDVWMSHGDKVIELPDGFVAIGESDNAPLAAMANTAKQFYGVQFHPEVTHTRQGGRILERFVVDVCGCEKLWTADNIIENAILEIKEKVGDDEVILGLSGGVDSSVTAMLLHRAIGPQLTCIFVDNGLLRLNEAEQVMSMFHDGFGLKVIKIDAEDQFLNALAGEVDPEAKRKIIGREFVTVFQRESSKLTRARWLAQGTIYPDVIESAGAKTGKAHVIKSHHNVGGLPEDMTLKLVEPLRELFKDEVRKIGLELGLPYDMLYRHPFPGPGLGVRILAEVKKEFTDLLRLADNIFIEELINHELYHKTSQAFAVFLPVKSVGVMGDARKYDYVIALRAVETIDFMTARWAHLPHEFLERVSGRIINEIDGISRVTYDISSKPPATIEWE